jgi:hypothetical protein
VIVVGEVVPVLLGEDAMELGELKGMNQQLDSVLAGVQQPEPEPVWAGVGRCVRHATQLVDLGVLWPVC